MFSVLTLLHEFLHDESYNGDSKLGTGVGGTGNSESLLVRIQSEIPSIDSYFSEITS